MSVVVPASTLRTYSSRGPPHVSPLVVKKTRVPSVDVQCWDWKLLPAEAKPEPARGTPHVGARTGARHRAHERRRPPGEVVDVVGAGHVAGKRRIHVGSHVRVDVAEVVSGDDLHTGGAEVRRERVQQGLAAAAVERDEAHVGTGEVRPEPVEGGCDAGGQVRRGRGDDVCAARHLRERREDVSGCPPGRGARRELIGAGTGRRSGRRRGELVQHAIAGDRERRREGDRIQVLVGQAHELVPAVVDRARGPCDLIGAGDGGKRRKRDHGARGEHRAMQRAFETRHTALSSPSLSRTCLRPARAATVGYRRETVNAAGS